MAYVWCEVLISYHQIEISEGLLVGRRILKNIMKKMEKYPEKNGQNISGGGGAWAPAPPLKSIPSQSQDVFQDSYWGLVADKRMGQALWVVSKNFAFLRKSRKLNFLKRKYESFEWPQMRSSKVHPLPIIPIKRVYNITKLQKLFTLAHFIWTPLSIF